MTNSESIQAAAPVSSMKMLVAMVGIGVMCALLIVLTFEFTGPAIAKNKAEALEKAIFKVLPGISEKADFQIDENMSFIEPVAEDKEAKMVYAGYDDQGDLVGLAIEASGIGFADVIKILYGYDPNAQKVIGFYVLESKETPGLGDKIEKDEVFLENFKALDVTLVEDLTALKNEVITVKKGAKENPWEIDAITGATISSRAIGDILGESTKFWMPLIYNAQEALQKPKDEQLIIQDE